MTQEEANAKSQQDAVEGLRKMQDLFGIDLAKLAEASGNKQAAKEMREQVGPPKVK